VESGDRETQPCHLPWVLCTFNYRPNCMGQSPSYTTNHFYETAQQISKGHVVECGQISEANLSFVMDAFIKIVYFLSFFLSFFLFNSSYY